MTPEPRFDLAETERRLERNRTDSAAMLSKADHFLLAGDLRSAGAWYRGVLNLAAEGRAVSFGERAKAEAAVEWIGQRQRQLLREGLDRAGLTRAERHPRFQQSLEIMLGERPRGTEGGNYPQLPQTYYYPDMPYVQFADPADYAWRASLEAQTETILTEALELLADQQAFTPYAKLQDGRPQGDVHGLLGNADWSTWELTDMGRPLPDRIARTPQTHAALEGAVPLCRIPNRAPTPMFSLLRPRSRIPAHTGMINARFICHLPLVVPSGCGFRVGEETREWQVGELMVFDDSVEHEAWNDSDHDRLVLIFDVWRPEVSELERQQIATLFDIVDAT